MILLKLLTFSADQKGITSQTIQAPSQALWPADKPPMPLVSLHQVVSRRGHDTAGRHGVYCIGAEPGVAGERLRGRIGFLLRETYYDPSLDLRF